MSEAHLCWLASRSRFGKWDDTFARAWVSQRMAGNTVSFHALPPCLLQCGWTLKEPTLPLKSKLGRLMLATSHTNLYTANHNNHWATPNCLSGDHLMKTQPIKQNVMAHFIIRGQSTGSFPCTWGRRAGKHAVCSRGAGGCRGALLGWLSTAWAQPGSSHRASWPASLWERFCNSEGHVHFLWCITSDAFCPLTFWSSLPGMQQWMHILKNKRKQATVL